MPAVALTDTNNLFGAMEFSIAASERGVQPIIGCQLNLIYPKDDPRRSDNRVLESDRHDQIVLIAKNQTGYLNLLKLVSKTWKNAQTLVTPLISYEDLITYNDGLIALTAHSQGLIGKHIILGNIDYATQKLTKLKDHFQDRLYVELSRTGRSIEKIIEPTFIDLAYKLNLPLVATNEAYFLDADMHEAHDALLCIADGAYVSQTERRQVSDHNRFKSAEEMIRLFHDIPEALENTVNIAKRCSFSVSPEKPSFPRFPCEKSEAEELRDQSLAGLEKRMEYQVYTAEMSDDEKQALRKEYFDRLDFELNVINNMGFPGYFLIVADFIKWAKAQGIPVGPGRGSGAGSIAAWALTITDIDPIKYNLIFERFLNPERVSMPDFDIDFCQERRDEVIKYVGQRYGQDHVAQIITFGKFQARMVIRDVGRVIQMPYGQVDRISKMIPNNPASPVTLAEAVEQDKDLQAEIRKDPTIARLIDIGKKLEGLYRHASTHAAGLVIGKKPLDEMVPLYFDPRTETPVTQFNMKDVEKAGLVKFDFLGLKTLTVMSHAIKLIAQKGINIDLLTISMDDPKTFELLIRCESVGVFQLESGGMVDVLRKLKPTRFEELIALVALFRPGPMDDIPRYLACKHGEEKVNYGHAMLEEILSETFGVMVYQEQVMQIAQKMGGYSLGAADLLRRAMGKKIKSEMDAQREQFVKGALDNGVNNKVAEKIFDQMAKFAGYGFNKSHSAPYALIAYQTAYLKANYPVEYMASLMTLDIANTDKLNIYKNEMDKLGIELLPPDVNKSDADFKVEGGCVRYALAGVKNVGEAAMQSIVNERNKNGEYKDIWDFINRVDAKALNKRLMEKLICAGAFDSLSPNRHQLFVSIDMLLSHAAAATQTRSSSQGSLFGQDTPMAASNIRMREIADWPILERLQNEFDAIGFYLTSHPLDNYLNILQNIKVISSNQLCDHLLTSEVVTMAGVITAKNERISKKNGNRYAFITLTDSYGVYEVTAFSEQLSEFRDILVVGNAVVIYANGKVESEVPRLTLGNVKILDDFISDIPSKYKILIKKQSAIDNLQNILKDATRGICEVSFQIPFETKIVSIKFPQKIRLNSEIKEKLERVEDIEILQEAS